MKRVAVLTTLAAVLTASVIAEEKPTAASVDAESAATPASGDMLSLLQEAQAEGLSSDERRERFLDMAVEKLDAELSLSDKQAQAMRQNLTERMVLMTELSDKYAEKGLRALRKMRREAQQIRDNQDKKLAEVLTDEQIKQYKKVRGQMRQDMRKYVMAHKDELRER